MIESKVPVAVVSRAIRRFHISQALRPGEAVASPDSSETQSNMVSVFQLPKLTADSKLTLEAVGEPPSAASVSLPPSLAVNIRRGSLLAVQGKSDNVSITQTRFEPLKRMLYGNLASRFTQVVSTEPVQLLVSARADTILPRIFTNKTIKAIAPIELDGKSDWALFRRDSLHVYSGPSLLIDTLKIPQKISRQLARDLGSKVRTETGLFSWLRAGYTFVGGRGVIGVVGNGLVYTVNVNAGEDFAVNKSCLLGVSINGPKDLQNSIVKLEQKTQAIPAVIMPPPKVAQIRTWTDFVINAKHYAWIAAKGIKDAYFFVRRQTRETPGFVRIIGPRTVLIQAGEPHDRFERSFELPSLESFGTPIASEEKPIPRIPADYLNTVTVGPKGVTIESTDSFVKK